MSWFLLSLIACGPDVDVFPAEKHQEWRVALDASDGANVPRDLAFDTDVADRLWIVNRADDTVLIVDGAFASNLDAIAIDRRKDLYANHFMEEASSISFGERQSFATCQESRNTYDGQADPNDFMGPALWSSDLDVFAEAFQSRWDGKLGSHLDMLHASPNCMGIAHELENVYWVFDGENGHLVRYDFQHDHGPGEDDHSDGTIRRFPEVELTRVPDVPGHMDADFEARALFIADTGGGRVIRFDLDSGTKARDLSLINEPLAEYSEYTGASFTVIAEGLDQPSGLELHGDHVFVSEHGTGDVIAFTRDGEEVGRVSTGLPGLTGLEIDSEGRLWAVDMVQHTVSVLSDARE